MTDNIERGHPRSSAPAGIFPGTSVTPTASSNSGMRPNQDHFVALENAGKPVPGGVIAFEAYLGSTTAPFHKRMLSDPRGMAREHRQLLDRAALNGARESVLAFCPSASVVAGKTKSGKPKYKPNPGTRHNDPLKCTYAAVGKYDIVLPDPVRNDLLTAVVATRSDFIRLIAATNGHVAQVAGTVELFTKLSEEVFLNLLLMPVQDMPIVAAVPRGSRGWDIYLRVMRVIEKLEKAGKNPLQGKRIMLYGLPRTMPDSNASYSMGALGQRATDTIHARPRPGRGGNKTPLERAHALEVYQPGLGTYAPAINAQQAPLSFGTAANVNALLGVGKGWTYDSAKMEANVIEATGVTSDWDRARPMSPAQRRVAFPALAPYWP